MILMVLNDEREDREDEFSGLHRLETVFRISQHVPQKTMATVIVVSIEGEWKRPVFVR